MNQYRELLNQGFEGMDSQSYFEKISAAYLEDEAVVLEGLIEFLDLSESDIATVEKEAQDLINTIRKAPDVEDSLDALLRQYSLNTKEGIVLMSLAEALLRVPDKETADALIRDKIAGVDWRSHKGKSNKSLVNLATLGLMLTGEIISEEEEKGIFKRMTQRLSEPVIRAAVNQAMQIMGKQFVLGRTIEEAIKNGRKTREKGYTYTFDMLGEAALTEKDAGIYYKSYEDAVKAAGKENPQPNSPKPSLSIKLSALHPRYEVAQRDRVMTELFESVKKLALLGKSLNVDISIDAEEADRLELSLHLFKKLLEVPEIRSWGGLGLVVQGYSKWALPVLIWTTLVGRELNVKIPLRLVKGAYWDTEIKAFQVRGLNQYPVYTRKENTDLSYLACAKYLLSDLTKGVIEPQFATHNAHTVASIIQLAGDREFEFQRLHGMGEALYDEVIKRTQKTVRIYAPVGEHRDLLPYLVRRLLENGANSSFVHQLVDPEIPVAQLTRHPLHIIRENETIANPAIPMACDILGDNRRNSEGLNVNIEGEWKPFEKELEGFLSHTWKATPMINGQPGEGKETHKVHSPFARHNEVGEVTFSSENDVKKAIDTLEKSWFKWNKRDVEERAQILEKMADLLEQNRAELIALCALEAGKTIQDGIDEVKEAVDFCRYYAIEARKHSQEIVFDGPTGERNSFYYEGKGIIACISPWNFPLAIYLGQITAALVAGNAVIAKPAETTSLIGYRALELLFEAGLPKDVIAYLPGSGREIGDILTQDHRIQGVAFTGSTATAQAINMNFARRGGALPTIIAETGGQNVMFVDSTALPEQVAKDALQSAFVSAGQRCSALRVLYLQEEIADRVIELLKGAINDLVVGKPYDLKTDVGPVIDENAKNALLEHINQLKSEGKLVAEGSISPELDAVGYFVPPTIFEIDSISELTKENFGPIMHIVRYKAGELKERIMDVNNTGFGLTMGVHSRNEETVQFIEYYSRVGNFYVNRNQVGAVVGVQPFGGLGLSGTGPKAGGPNYLLRFMIERSVSNNIAAIGGNTALLSLQQ